MAAYHIEALELVAQGDWHGAHRLIQDHSDPLACLIHAYLHQLEGDSSNAQYWYQRAGASMPSHSLEEEFERLSKLAKE